MPSPENFPGVLAPTGLGAAVGGPGRAGRPPGPSTKPALIVLGLTLALFAVGVTLEVLSGSQSRPTPAPTKIATARGAVLHAVPARPLLKAIVTPSQPPDDLLDALAVPADATAVPSSAVDRGVELYDRSLRFEVPRSEQDVITFFRAELPALHWRRLSQGPTGTGATQYLILEQHPASDGHEWDLGVTVSPTVFSGDSGTATGTGTTAFTLRLYSVSDQD